MTIKTLITQLLAMGFTFDYEGGGTFSLITQTHKTSKVKWSKNDEDMTIFSAELEEEPLDFCCGVIELGGFSIDTEISPRKDGPLSKIKLEELKALFVKGLFLFYKDQHNKSKATTAVPTCRPVIYCNNGNKLVETALMSLKEDFKLVASTRNPGSKNIITTYISIQ